MSAPEPNISQLVANGNDVLPGFLKAVRSYGFAAALDAFMVLRFGKAFTNAHFGEAFWQPHLADTKARLVTFPIAASTPLETELAAFIASRYAPDKKDYSTAVAIGARSESKVLIDAIRHEAASSSTGAEVKAMLLQSLIDASTVYGSPETNPLAATALLQVFESVRLQGLYPKAARGQLSGDHAKSRLEAVVLQEELLASFITHAGPFFRRATLEALNDFDASVSRRRTVFTSALRLRGHIDNQRAQFLFEVIGTTFGDADPAIAKILTRGVKRANKAWAEPEALSFPQNVRLEIAKAVLSEYEHGQSEVPQHLARSAQVFVDSILKEVPLRWEPNTPYPGQTFVNYRDFLLRILANTPSPMVRERVATALMSGVASLNGAREALTPSLMMNIASRVFSNEPAKACALVAESNAPYVVACGMTRIATRQNIRDAFTPSDLRILQGFSSAVARGDVQELSGSVRAQISELRTELNEIVSIVATGLEASGFGI